VFFYFLPLIKDAKSIILYSAFSFFYNFTTVKALPPFKIYEVVKEGLDNHQAAAFRALHFMLSSLRPMLPLLKSGKLIKLLPPLPLAFSRSNIF